MIGGLPGLRKREPPTRVHAVMNLPELALDFLDAFRDMVLSRKSALFSGSPVELVVHCYCFAREKDRPEEEIHPRMVAAMGCVPPGTRIREVRDVAPKKNMYCVEFSLPLGEADPLDSEDLAAAHREDGAKRQRVD
mmetsp:Transcript_4037/g.11487  ORF Transcript_4037/g.11487 Transcript_4037/m.11487 type:complete len:136 (+) Transcript_4037:3-410(+)